MTPPPPVRAPGKPPRKVRTWVVVLVSVCALVVAGCLFGGIRLILGIQRVTGIEKEINRTTGAFIEDSRDGFGQAEYDALCTSAKQELTRAEFAEPVPPERVITAHEITSNDVDYARRQATVGVEVTRADGSTSHEVYILEEEGERWRMCAFPPR